MNKVYWDVSSKNYWTYEKCSHKIISEELWKKKSSESQFLSVIRETETCKVFIFRATPRSATCWMTPTSWDRPWRWSGRYKTKNSTLFFKENKLGNYFNLQKPEHDAGNDAQSRHCDPKPAGNSWGRGRAGASLQWRPRAASELHDGKFGRQPLCV